VELLLLQVSSFVYFTAALVLMWQTLRADPAAARLGNGALAVGFLLHSFAIGSHLLQLGFFPVTNFDEGLSFFAWLIVGAYLVIGRGVNLSVIGAVVSPLAFVMTFGATVVYTDAGTVPPALRSPLFPLHVTLAFLGNAVFALAFAVSIVYLVQENLLKTHRNGWMIRRLPSLEELDRLNYRCLAWGFPLLTLGILSGGVWALKVFGTFWSWEAREVLSLVTWLIYGALLQFRLTAGLRGRRAARLTIVGFGLVVISFLSVNLLPLPGRHGGGLGL